MGLQTKVVRHVELLVDKPSHGSEARDNLKSTLVTSQLPIEHWHEQIGDPTMADAILDRLVHSAHKIKLTGESMRKKTANLT